MRYPGAVFRPVWHPTPPPASVLPGTDGSVPPRRDPREDRPLRYDRSKPPWELSAPWASALKRANLFTPDLSRVPTRDRRETMAFWPFLPAPWTVSAPWLIESRRLRFFTPDLSSVPTSRPTVSIVPYLTPAWTVRGPWQYPPAKLLPATFVAGAFQPFIPLGQLTAAPWTLSAPWLNWRRAFFTPDASTPPTIAPALSLAAVMGLPPRWDVSAPWRRLLLPVFTPDASEVPTARPPVPLAAYLPSPWALAGPWAPRAMYLPETFIAQAFVPFAPLSLLTAAPWALSAPWRRLLLPVFTPDASEVPTARPPVPLAAYLPPAWTVAGPWLPRALYPLDTLVAEAVPFVPLRVLTAPPWALSAPWQAFLRSASVFTPDASVVPTQTPRVPLTPYLPAPWAVAGAWAPRSPYPLDTFVAAAGIPFVPLPTLAQAPWTLGPQWRAYLRALSAFTPDASVPPPFPPRFSFTPFLPPDWTLRAPYQPTPRLLFPPDPVVFNLLRLLEQHPWELTAPWRTMLRQRNLFTPDASTVPLSDPAVGRRAWEARTRLAPQPWRIPPRWQPITLIPLGPARVLIVPGIATAYLVPSMDVDFTALTDQRVWQAPLIIVDFTVPSQTTDFDATEPEEDEG